MLKKLFLWIIFGLLLFSTGCQPAAPAPTPTAISPTATVLPPTTTAIPPTPTQAAPVLEIVAPDGSTQSLTMAELQALPTVEGQAGIKSSTGEITLPKHYKGVSLKDLAALVPGFDETMGISVVAEDGYAITYSYDQATNGSFISYDPGTGDELKSPVPLTALLAYEVDGQPLDAKEDGNLRVVIVSGEPKQVTDGHWSVKWVTKLEIKSLGKEWSLHLEGAINELMDRATFESGASPNCHGLTWKDDKAQEWVGIPLYLLVGRVDDDIKHEGPAFNDEAAAAGYTVDVVASDGYTVSFDSARIARNKNMLVAHLVNGNPLPDKYFPLRLVGSDLQKNEMVGMIEKIIVHVEPIPVAAETTAPVETEPAGTETAEVSGAGLVITGLVENELTLDEEGLRAMEVVKITAETKKGKQDFEGVRLSDLLEQAKVKPAAKKLVFTAADGFKAEVFLAEINNCSDCLVGFTDTPGMFTMVLPGLPGSVWVKDVIKIEIL
jgi:DMSO/TMAO reductase YedYZ molybdopterin-dependent catalytic subunit